MCHCDWLRTGLRHSTGDSTDLEVRSFNLFAKTQHALEIPKRIFNSYSFFKIGLLLLHAALGALCSSLPSFAETGCQSSQDYLLDSGNQLNFTVKEFGNYENIEGLMCNLPDEAALISARAVEQLRTADGVVSSTGQDSIKNVTDVSGLLAHTVKSLEYGAWYFSESDHRFLFQPNAEKINSIGEDEHVVSSLEVGTVSPTEGEFRVISSVAVIIEGSDPVVSVAADSEDAGEDGKVRFKLFANQASRTERIIALSVNYEGKGYRNRTVHSLTLPAEETCRIASVNVPETAAPLNRATGRSLAEGSENGDRQLDEVLDEDLFNTAASVRLAVEPGNRYQRSEVNGSATVGYAVGGQTASSHILDAEFNVEFTESDCETSNAPVVAIAAGVLAVAAATVTTVAVVASGSDSNNEPVEVAPKVEEDKNKKVVDDKPKSVDEDDATLPIVSIKSDLTFVREDSTDNRNFFYLEISEVPESDIVVNLQIDSPGDYIKGVIPNTMTISVDQLRKYFRFNIDDDNTDEEDSEISVTVLKGTDYEVSAGPGNTASVTVKDDDVPEISFSNLTETGRMIDEAGSITYELSADIAPWQDLAVNVQLIGKGFLKPGQSELTATIAAGSRTGEFTISPHDDNKIEDDGEIQIQLLEDGNSEKNYKLNSNSIKTRTELTVTDNDVPELSIRPLSDSVVVCNPVRFEVSANYSREKVLFVALRYEYVEEDMFLENQYEIGQETLVKGDEEVVLEFSIPTGFNHLLNQMGREKLDDGSVTATLVKTNINEYNISERHGSATVEVKKNSVSSCEAGRTSGQVTGIQEHSTGLKSFAMQGKPDVDSSVPVAKVVAAAGEISEGEAAGFRVELDRSAESRLFVNLFWSAEGNFMDSGSDQLEIHAGKTETNLELATISDSVPEPDGSVEVTIASGNGYQVHPIEGTASVAILDDDSASGAEGIAAIHRNILPSMLSESSSRLVETVFSRIGSAFALPKQSEFELAGASDFEGAMELVGRILNSSDLDLNDTLRNSSFTVALFPEGTGNSTTIWGRGVGNNVSDTAEADKLKWEGESFTGNIGFDTQLGNGILFGLTVSSSEDNVEFKHGQNGSPVEGEYSSRLAGMQPYLAWTNADRSTQIQGTFGFGLGEVELDIDNSNPNAAESERILASLGGNSLLYSSGSREEGESSKLTLSTVAWISSQTYGFNDEIPIESTATTGSMRFDAAGSHKKTLSDGSTFNPMLAIGARWDEGFGKDGLGLELLKSASYENPVGIDVSGIARVSVSDPISGGVEGLRGELNYDSGNDKIGAFTSFASAWGVLNESRARKLWDNRAERFGQQPYADYQGTRLDANIGYGFGILDGNAILAPYASAGLYEGGRNNYGIGSSFEIGKGMNIHIMQLHESLSSGSTEHTFKLDGTLNW